MKLLKLGSVVCFIVSVLHVAIIFGGPDWYRFFGAGEGMAQLAEQGSRLPAIVTAMIALLLCLVGIYGLSGAKVLPRLPLLKVVLWLISLAFLARGLFGIPLVVFVDDPYLKELESRMIFMVITSFISICIGICYLCGVTKIWSEGKLGNRSLQDSA